MSEAENPTRSSAPQVTVEDVRELCGASTPHFALQIRNRIARLIADLPADSPARLLGEQEMARLTDARPGRRAARAPRRGGPHAARLA